MIGDPLNFKYHTDRDEKDRPFKELPKKPYEMDVIQYLLNQNDDIL
jgi:hypothetical protein